MSPAGLSAAIDRLWAPLPLGLEQMAKDGHEYGADCESDDSAQQIRIHLHSSLGWDSIGEPYPQPVAIANGFDAALFG